MAASVITSGFRFGQHQCNKSNLFYATKLSYGFVNLKPVVPRSSLPSFPSYSLSRLTLRLLDPLAHILHLPSIRIHLTCRASLTLDACFREINRTRHATHKIFRFEVHVLVIPKRHVLRYADLTVDEITDLWVSSQRYVIGVLRPKREQHFRLIRRSLSNGFFSLQHRIYHREAHGCWRSHLRYSRWQGRRSNGATRTRTHHAKTRRRF